MKSAAKKLPLDQWIVDAGGRAEVIALGGALDKAKTALHKRDAAGIRAAIGLSLEANPRLGSTPLPNGKSWIKGLCDIDCKLALWWADTAPQAWARGNNPELSALEELCFHHTHQQRKHISSDFILLLHKGIEHGLPLTHEETDAWIAPVSPEQARRCEVAQRFVGRLVEYGHKQNSVGDLLSAYVQADGPLAICLPKRVNCIGVGGFVDPQEAIEAGYDLAREAIGKPGGWWWETGMVGFDENQRKAVLERARLMGFDISRACDDHAYKTASELYLAEIKNPERALGRMIDYLMSAPNGLDTTTLEGDLAWQRVLCESMGLDQLYSHIEQFPELDWAAHTTSSNLMMCAAKFGGLSHVELPGTILELEQRIASSGPSQTPLLELASCFTDRNIKAEVKTRLCLLMEKHPIQWFGSMDQQKTLATQLLRNNAAMGWLMHASDAFLAMKTVAPELMWTARLVAACNPNDYPELNAPDHFPTRVEAVDGAWLDAAKRYGDVNLPNEAKSAWRADFQSLEMSSRDWEPRTQRGPRQRL